MIRRLLLGVTLLPPGLRRRMATGLGRRSSSKNVHALIRGLNDDNQGVRDASADALKAIGPSAASALIAALTSESSQCRPRIALALGQIGAAP
jgi:HEAT repeat protein